MRSDVFLVSVFEDSFISSISFVVMLTFLFQFLPFQRLARDFRTGFVCLTVSIQIRFYFWPYLFVK